jgi:hypothetical protein
VLQRLGEGAELEAFVLLPGIFREERDREGGEGEGGGPSQKTAAVEGLDWTHDGSPYRCLRGSARVEIVPDRILIRS